MKPKEFFKTVWEDPTKTTPTHSELEKINSLENFLTESRRFTGIVLCGPHGVGKTFVVRYLLAKHSQLEQSYVNLNLLLSERLIAAEKTYLSSTFIHDEIIQIFSSSQNSLNVLDGCELILKLPEKYLRTILVSLNRHSGGRIIMVLPLSTQPTSVDSLYLDYPTQEDVNSFFGTIPFVPPSLKGEKTFPEIIRRLIK